jgi:hypothetical protein
MHKKTFVQLTIYPVIRRDHHHPEAASQQQFLHLAEGPKLLLLTVLCESIFATISAMIRGPTVSHTGATAVNPPLTAMFSYADPEPPTPFWIGLTQQGLHGPHTRTRGRPYTHSGPLTRTLPRRLRGPRPSDTLKLRDRSWRACRIETHSTGIASLLINI